MTVKKILIIGLGNPILGDDGVGWRIVEELQKRLRFEEDTQSSIDFDCASLGGLSLMERLTSYDRAILVDSIFTGQKPIGTVSRFVLSDLPDLTAGHSASAHDTSLRTALSVGRSMDIPLPEDEDVLIVAIEARSIYDFSEKLSPPVEASVPVAVETVLELVKS